MFDHCIFNFIIIFVLLKQNNSELIKLNRFIKLNLQMFNNNIKLIREVLISDRNLVVI